jgi:hypothetical protein
VWRALDPSSSGLRLSDSRLPARCLLSAGWPAAHPAAHPAVDGRVSAAQVVLVVSDLLGCAGKAIKFAKAFEEKSVEAKSQEARKEAGRALGRLKGKDKDEARQLAKSLDERKDTYLDLLTNTAGTDELPPFLHRRNQNRESGIGDNETTIYGVWLTRSSRDPYGKVKGRQEDREAAAYFSHSYAHVALPALRARTFKESETGVPIEYFRWRRVIVDECHEPLCMGADDTEEAHVRHPNCGPCHSSCCAAAEPRVGIPVGRRPSRRSARRAPCASCSGFRCPTSRVGRSSRSAARLG